MNYKTKIDTSNNSTSKVQIHSIKRRDVLCRKIIEYGILGLIIFSPLPAASVHEWSILVIQLTVIVMMVAYLMMKEKPQTNILLNRSLRWPKYLFMSLFIFLFVQIIPLPKFLVGVLSPSAFSFQANFFPGFSKINLMSLSIIPSHTLQETLELLSYFLLGFFIVKTIKEKRQIFRFFYVLIAMGVFEAFYGMFELYNKNPRILFYKKIHYLDSVTGTFVNRNHLSGYLEMIIPLAIGFIIANTNLFGLAGLTWREKLFRLSEKRFSTNLLISFGIIIMSIGIIFSNSRTGVFLLILTFILFLQLTILHYRRTDTQRRLIKNFLVAVFLVAILISLYVGIDSMLERFSQDRLLRVKRPIFWTNTFGIFTKFPIFGTGLGTFASLYPDWEEGSTLVRLYHAHNDYLEYLSEIGVVGTILLFGGIFYLVINSFLIWRERKHPAVVGLGLGSIIALVCILIHSITDFNLHIPANMLLFSVVISLTVVIVFYRKAEQRENR